MLTNEEKVYFKNKLEELKNSIEKNHNMASNEIAASLSNELKDEGDNAVRNLNSSINRSLMENQTKQLKQVKASLLKLEEGTYGICELCDEYIRSERLKVKPFAQYCISCREIMEKKHNLDEAV